MKYTKEQLARYKVELADAGYSSRTLIANYSGLNTFDKIANGELNDVTKAAAVKHLQSATAKRQMDMWVDRFEKWLQTGVVEKSARMTTKEREDLERLRLETEIAETSERVLKLWRRKKKEEWRQNAILKTRIDCARKPKY